jgi:hypothetical protein
MRNRKARSWNLPDQDISNALELPAKHLATGGLNPSDTQADLGALQRTYSVFPGRRRS